MAHVGFLPRFGLGAQMERNLHADFFNFGAPPVEIGQKTFPDGL